MRTMTLDFLHPHRSWATVGALLLIAGLIASGVVVWRHQSLLTERSEIGLQLVNSKPFERRNVSEVRGTTGDPKLVMLEVSRANAVLAKLAVPWDTLFSELESASSPDVSLLSVQPESAGKQVRLSGAARRFESVLEYIARLEKGASFANVVLVGHELRPDAQYAAAFTLTAEWVERP